MTIDSQKRFGKLNKDICHPAKSSDVKRMLTKILNFLEKMLKIIFLNINSSNIGAIRTIGIIRIGNAFKVLIVLLSVDVSKNVLTNEMIIVPTKVIKNPMQITNKDFLTVDLSFSKTFTFKSSFKR